MLPIKFGLLIGRGIIITGLGIIGYVGGAEPTPEVANGIRTLMVYAPAITSIIAAIIFYAGYRIKDTDIQQMQNEIAAK
jgi:glycoside/pentoside/hexuronide:cation symporter, GPH family